MPTNQPGDRYGYRVTIGRSTWQLVYSSTFSGIWLVVQDNPDTSVKTVDSAIAWQLPLFDDQLPRPFHYH